MRRRLVMRVMRERAGLGQRALAEALGVSQPAVAGWESGTRRIPPGRRPAIAKALGCHPADLTLDWDTYLYREMLADEEGTP